MITKTNCQLCGVEMEITNRNQKHCAVCRNAAKGIVEKRSTSTGNREKAKAALSVLSAGGIKWDEFDLTGKSLARVDAEAKLFGMSYGQYTAAVRGGSIKQILKYKGIKNPKKMLRELKTR